MSSKLIEISNDFHDNWQEITDLLADLLEVPAALIMRVEDNYIEVCISSQSKGNPYSPGDHEEFENSGLYCETVVKTNNKLLVPNATEDERWKNNPDVKLNMISYLGFPILMPDKKPFGTICVLDSKTNHYSTTVDKLILKFKNLIESHLEILYINQVLGMKGKQVSDYLSELKLLKKMVPICSNCKSIRDDQKKWHPIESFINTRDDIKLSHGICPSCVDRLYPEFKKSLEGS